MDANPAGRYLAGDAVVHFNDPSITWSDWKDFMDGYGNVYLCGDLKGSRGEVLINENYSANSGKRSADRSNPMQFVGDIHVDLKIYSQVASLRVRAHGQLCVTSDVQKVWRTHIKRWLDEQKITYDHAVWPLISDSPEPSFTAMLWAIVRNPVNSELAHNLMRKKPRGRAMEIICPMLGTMGIDDVRYQKQLRSGY